MRMLANLPHQRPAVVFWHPVFRFDEIASVDAGVKFLLQLQFFGTAQLRFGSSF